MKASAKQDGKRDVSTRLYRGVSSKGIKIQTDGVIGYFAGEVFRLEKRDTVDGTTWKKKKLHATPGFTNTTPVAFSFRCQGVTGKHTYRINCTPIVPPSANSKADKTPSKKRKTLVLQAPKGKKRSLASQVDAIAAQRQAGLDPDVRMSFIVTYVGESRANLYKKMGQDFPMPTKRGRGSFWPLSVIDAYKAKTSREGGRNGQ